MYSLTYGKVTFEEMVNIIKKFIEEQPDNRYNISVGTDSQNFGYTKLVVVVAVHRVGKGGIFFYDINRIEQINNIPQKLLYETSVSIDIATKLSETFQKEEINYNISIHVDAGEKGKTSKIIPEIVGWIKACGFKCETKPNSYAASSIADKFSK